MHNGHVYKYYRWLGWVAKQQKRHLRSFFMWEFAEQEKIQQLTFNLSM